jgi:hypothetical protein
MVWSSGEIAQTLFKPPGPPLFRLEALGEIAHKSTISVFHKKEKHQGTIAKYKSGYMLE